MADNNVNKLTVLLEADSKRLEAGLKKANEGVKGFSEKTKKASNNLNNFNNELKNVSRYIVGAFAVDRIVEFGRELVSLGAKSDGVSRAFNEMALGANLSIEQLRNSTKGAVSDIDLMQQAVQARNFKIPLEGLSELFEFAAIRAQQTGESVEYLTRSIVLGIGRKSPLILDNLGITLVRLKEAMGKVGRESATVEDIFNATVKIAKEETEVIKLLGDDSLTAANKIDGLAAAFKNVKTMMGESIVQSELFSDAITSLTENMERNLLEGRLRKIFEDADLMEILNAKGFESEFFSLFSDPDAIIDSKSLEQLRAMSREADNAKNAFRDLKGKEALQILPKGAVDMAVKDFAKMKEFGQTLLDSTPITKYAQERARAFAQMVEERSKVLSLEIQQEGTAAQQIEEIHSALSAKIRENAELYSQRPQMSEAMTKIKSDISAYSKALMSLESRGEKGSAIYTQYTAVMNALRAALSSMAVDVNMVELAYKNATSAMKDFFDTNWESSSLKSFVDEAKKGLFADKLKKEIDEVDQHFKENADWLGANDTEDAEPIIKPSDLDGLRQLSTMMTSLSNAFGQISQLFGGADSGIGRFVAGFSKVVTVVAAAVGALAAFQTLSGNIGSAALAIGVATGVAGVISGLANVSAGANSGGGYNIGNMSGQSLYTEISGRNLRIVIDRDRGFSDRRGG